MRTDDQQGASQLSTLNSQLSTLLIPISSNSGLCGAFNSNMGKATLSRIQELEQMGKQVHLLPIGKKIAQRIILELKDKIGGGGMELDFSAGNAAAAPVQQGSNAALANAALQELGYSPAEISAALKGVDPNATTEEMVRHALRAMVMKS